MESVHTHRGPDRTRTGFSFRGERAEKNTMAVRTPCHIKKTPKHSKRERTRAQRCVQKEMSDFSLPCAHKERKETKTQRDCGSVGPWDRGGACEQGEAEPGHPVF